VMVAIPGASERRVCRVLEVARWAARDREGGGDAPRREELFDEDLAAAIFSLIIQHPTFGYRRVWALLRFGQGREVNRKKVYRIMKLKGWTTHQRRVTPRPRVRGSRSVAASSNARWAMDLTHVYCGEDGWGHLVAVIDCHDREIVGWEFALRGRAKEAERALEEACINRFGTLRVVGNGPVIRSDNGLVFLSKRFRQACRFYRLTQEFVTPYTPKQNGVVERFFRSLKEECVWQHLSESYREAKSTISRWIRWYNEERPHQALGYLSPSRYRVQQQPLVA